MLKPFAYLKGLRSKKLAGRPSIHIAAVIVLGILVYSHTLSAPFCFDDSIFVNNPKIESLKNIPDFFLRPAGMFASRPVLHTTVALNYYLDGFNTRGFHVLNICIHLLNAVLVYLLLMKTLSLIGRAEGFSRTAAAVAALVFVVHPLQTDAVTYIVSRTMLLATTFYLFGLMIFIRAVMSGRNKLFYAAALFAVSLLGVASRENFATFPVMLFVFDFFFISDLSIRKTARHYWAYLPVLASLGYLAFLVTRNTYLRDTAYGQGVPNADYLWTQFSVQWTYLRLFVLPFNQNIDYDYPKAKSLLELRTAIACVGYIGLWAGAALLARRKRFVSYSLLWFLIALLPISFGVVLLDLRLEDVIFEHRLYLPSVGLVGIVGVGAASAFDRLRAGKRRVAFVSLAVVLMLALGVTAFARNEVWRSQIDIWKDVTEKSPRKPRGFHMLVGSYSNRGVEYMNEGQLIKAEEYFDIAVKMDPDNADVHNNLGFLYLKRGNGGSARGEFERALAIRPSSSEAHLGLGRALKSLDLRDEAERQFKISASLAQSAAAHYYLGVMYMEDNQLLDARIEFRKALSIDPGHADARRFLNYISNPRNIPNH